MPHSFSFGVLFLSFELFCRATKSLQGIEQRNNPVLVKQKR